MNTIKNLENNSTLETKFDKDGNKVSMFETVKEVYDETIIKEQIVSLSQNKTTSHQAGNVKYMYDINTLLMIEAGVPKKCKMGHLKEDNIYLMNYRKDIFQYQLLENVMGDDNKKDDNVEKCLLLTNG